MTSPGFDLLRLGVALAHAVPGAEIHMTAPARSNLAVSSSPSADMDICDSPDRARRLPGGGAAPLLRCAPRPARLRPPPTNGNTQTPDPNTPKTQYQGEEQ